MKTKALSILLIFVLLFNTFAVLFGSVGVFADGTESDFTSETDPSDSDNIAYKKPTRSDSYSSGHENAVDGSLDTEWCATCMTKYVDIDLGKNYDITKLKLFFPDDYKCTFKIYGSVDGVTFNRLFTSPSLVSSKEGGYEVIPDAENKVCRIVRVSVINASLTHKCSVSEVRIYGTLTDSEVIPTREKLEFTSYTDWLKENCGVTVSSESGYDIRDTYTVDDTVNELNGLVSRILGDEYVSWFEFSPTNKPEENDKSWYSIEDTSDGKIKISGDTGCDISAGLNYYLKYYCNVCITQETSRVVMPESAPKVGERIFTESAMKIRYAYNYNTPSYTLAFFGYEAWRREIDWLLLQGVNLILDLNGAESVWLRFLQTLGYTADEAKCFPCGYTLKAWWMMDNIEGFGGTVSDSWIYDTLELARINQRSLTVMGGSTALQVFTGGLPESFSDIAGDYLLEKGYSDVSDYLTPQPAWVAEGIRRPDSLSTAYDGYEYLASLFYDCQKYIYGETTQYYCGDICHEGGTVPEGITLAQMSSDALDALLASDGDAYWVIQRWVLNPRPEMLNSFGDRRQTNVIVLDLTSAQNSENYSSTSYYGSAEYGGTPWIFGSLDNVGGGPMMHSKLQEVADSMAEAKKNYSLIVGIGIDPEGTQTNPVYYELFYEMAWRDEAPDVNEWIKDWLARRYGEEGKSENIVSAWEKLLATVYSADTYPSNEGYNLINVLCKTPRLFYSGAYFESEYDISELYTALELMMQSFDKLSDNECYIYDIVEIMQTYLDKLAVECLKKANYYYLEDTSYSELEGYLNKFLGIMALLDEAASYSENQLLGRFSNGRIEEWINDSRTGSYDDYDYDTMMYDAKMLITHWDSNMGMMDYGTRLYNGLISDCFTAGWRMYISSLLAAVKKGTYLSDELNTEADKAAHNDLEKLFCATDKEYKSEKSNPNGDLTSRGMKALFANIKAYYNASTDSLEKATGAITCKSGSSLVRSGYTVSGINDNIKVSELLALLGCQKDGSLSAVNQNGEALSDGDSVVSGCRVILTVNGEMTDAVVIGTVKYADDKEEAKAEESRKAISDFRDFAVGLNREGLSDEVIAELNKGIVLSKEITESNLVFSLPVLTERAKELDGIRKNVEKEYFALHPDEKPTGTVNTTVIIIGCVAAVVVICAVTAAVIVTKNKKKKSKADAE